MIKTPILRAYSTARLGQVISTGSRVALHAPAAISQSDIFARLKRDDRADVRDKVERSLLWEQIGTNKKRLVFRPTQSQSLVNREEPLKIMFRLGKSEQEIELQPKKYDGPPSLQDLRVLVTTSETAEQVQNALDILSECVMHKSTSRNVQSELFRQLLRRAAATGCFQSVYAQITGERARFEKYLDQFFYQEALRIYALRIPYMSRRGKAMLHRAYRRSTPNASRDMVMLYALSAYGKTYGANLVGDLSPYIESIEKMSESPKLLKKLALEDLALGAEGLREAGVPEDATAAKLVESLLLKRSRYRPQVETLVVELADRHDETGASVEEQAQS